MGIQTPILNLELSDNGVTFIAMDVKLIKLELLQKKVRITTMVQNIPTITAIITYRTLSLFDNTIGVEVTLGQLSNKILLDWNIKGIHFIDVAWNGKILCTGIKFLATPLVTDA